MRRYEKKYCREKFMNVPDCIRGFSGSEEIVDILDSINGTHKIDRNILNRELYYIFCGIERSVDFTKNIKTYLHLSEEKADAISKDVYIKIFLPMLDMVLSEGQD